MASKTLDRPQPGSDNRRYLTLVRKHSLRPIRSEGELERAIAMVDSLIARGELDDGERDYLLVLGRLVEDCEKEAHPIGPVSDAVMLRFLIDSNRVTQAAVASATGIAESTISAVLAGKKTFRRQQVAIVARFFRVASDVFSLDPPTEARSGAGKGCWRGVRNHAGCNGGHGGPPYFGASSASSSAPTPHYRSGPVST